MKTFAIVEI